MCHIHISAEQQQNHGDNYVTNLCSERRQSSILADKAVSDSKAVSEQWPDVPAEGQYQIGYF